MKLTKSKLKEIIREELLKEGNFDSDSFYNLMKELKKVNRDVLKIIDKYHRLILKNEKLF